MSAVPILTDCNNTRMAQTRREEKKAGSQRKVWREGGREAEEGLEEDK